MAEGKVKANFEKGFCAELDELADTLKQTADALSRTENFRREFLSNISHDLRTPLTMIRGYAEMVRDFSWEEEEQRKMDLAVIIWKANRLTDLVNDILDYTALQEAPSTKFEEVDMSTAAQMVVEQFKPLCLRNGCDLEAQIFPGLLVYGDRQQLSRVLYNLLDNAISHAGEKRKVQFVLKDTGCARLHRGA